MSNLNFSKKTEMSKETEENDMFELIKNHFWINEVLSILAKKKITYGNDDEKLFCFNSCWNFW
jgi:hypothetical protein